MRQYNSENLVIHPAFGPDPDVIVEVTPQAAGWDTINFQAAGWRRGRRGTSRQARTSWRWSCWAARST